MPLQICYMPPPRRPSMVVQAATSAAPRAPPSTQPTTALDVDLVRELQVLHLSTANETPSSSRQARLPENQTSGRPLSIDEICQHLRRVWANNYAAVSEISETNNLLLATFMSNAAMMTVVTRQPWQIRKQNLLLELYDPRKSLSNYQFRYLYASVRLYGIPGEARNQQRINVIMYQIGQPSDLDEQSHATIMRNEFYALVRVKLNITRNAVDKVFVNIEGENDRRIIVLVYYEGIHRICIYCGSFFQNFTECTHRQNAVLLDDTQEVPRGNHGTWMTQEHDIFHTIWPYILQQTRSNIPRALNPSATLANLKAQHAALMNPDTARNTDPGAPTQRPQTIQPAKLRAKESDDQELPAKAQLQGQPPSEQQQNRIAPAHLQTEPTQADSHDPPVQQNQLSQGMELDNNKTVPETQNQANSLISIHDTDETLSSEKQDQSEAASSEATWTQSTQQEVNMTVHQESAPHAELIFDDYAASALRVESGQVPGHYLSPLGGLGSSAALRRPIQLVAPDPAPEPSGDDVGRGTTIRLLPLQQLRHAMASERAPEEP
ncbi:hypothetical protein BDA96_05G116300 [Sorghum bicolor]|uniref:DUF4283 domain-containing protein n=1 Tax=Sorghum bicolor TaxID=4558 RepID=A0A921QZF9_SORBI|nr:hypothetical protein BDA96_05G116300 [Sorghum bicolor]